VKIPGDLVDDGIWVSEGAEIGNMAALRPPVVVGAGARIEAGALVGEYSVVGPSLHHSGRSVSSKVHTVDRLLHWIWCRRRMERYSGAE